MGGYLFSSIFLNLKYICVNLFKQHNIKMNETHCIPGLFTTTFGPIETNSIFC